MESQYDFYRIYICHQHPDERTRVKDEMLLLHVMDIDIEKIGNELVPPRRKISLTAMTPYRFKILLEI
jgi:hypothetical protein